MASLLKNVASQNFPFALVTTAGGIASTTTSTTSLTAFVTKDGTQASAGGTFTYLGTGEWNYAPTQAETNATSVALYVTQTGGIPFHGTVWTDVVDANGLKSVNLVDIAGAAVATGSAQLGVNVVNIAGQAAQLDANNLLKVDFEDIKGLAVTSTSTALGVNVVTFGGTAVTGRDIGASVLISTGTGTGQLAVTSGVIQSNLTQINGAAVTSSSTGLGVNVVTFGGTAVTGRDIGASVLLSSGTGTGQISMTAGVPQANVIQVNGVVSSTATAMMGVNVVDFGNTVVTGRDIGASVLLSSGTGTGQLNIAAGVAQTNPIQFGGTAVTGRDIGASVLLSNGTGTGQLSFSSGIVQSNLQQIVNSSQAASNLNNSTLSICFGTASSGTTATVVASSITNPALLTDPGQLIGRTIIFLGNSTTPGLDAQASNITANTTGATPTITYTAMTRAPTSGDTFVIL